MVKFIVWLYLGFFVYGNSFSQSISNEIDKRVIDTAAIRASQRWPRIWNESLSRDGKFILYELKDQPPGSSTLIAQSTDNQWKKEFLGVGEGEISPDSRWGLFMQGDSLCLLSLGSAEIVYVTNVERYALFERGGSNWLAYVSNIGSKELVLKELNTSRMQRLVSCENFWFNAARTRLLWESTEKNGNQIFHGLQWMDLETEGVHKILTSDTYGKVLDINWNEKSNTVLYTVLDVARRDSTYSLHRYSMSNSSDAVVWHGRIKAGKCDFDVMGDQLIFLVQDTIWYCRENMKQAIPIVTNSAPGLDDILHISGSPGFTKDSKKVIFNVIRPSVVETPTHGAKVDVWHYKDKELQSAQALIPHPKIRTYIAVLDIAEEKITRIVSSDEQITILAFTNEYVLVEKRRAGFDEWCWQAVEGQGYYLISLENGSRRKIPIDNRYFDPVIKLSPHEDYVIYYDPAHDGYKSYEIASGKIQDITKGLGVSWRNEMDYQQSNAPNPFFGVNPCPRGIAGWADGNSLLLLYDSPAVVGVPMLVPHD